MPQQSGDSAHMLPIVRLVRSKVAESGLTLRDFAAQRGVSYGTVRRYHDPALEALRQPARIQTMKELAAALRVDIEDVEAAFVSSTIYSAAAASTLPTVSQSGTGTVTDPAEPEAPYFDVVHAIRNDPDLLPEAKEHLERQYGLLRRLNPQQSAEQVRAEVTAEKVAELRARRQPNKQAQAKADNPAPRKTPAKRPR